MRFKWMAVLGIALAGAINCVAAQTAERLEQGFASPPREARLRAYWWWLNGNVTKASITRDLEEMAAKGFGGALICDAGGAEQDGNDRVPHGPTFFTPEWRELYRHALREADRLGLEMSLNIQSGWNLGGPMVKPEDAPKKLVWSEWRVSGPAKIQQKLAVPKHAPAFYRDVAVLACRLNTQQKAESAFSGLVASSEQREHPAKDALDGRADSFWVSQGTKPGEGPSRQKPEWLQFNFAQPVAVAGLTLAGRAGYGPREGELQASDDGNTWRAVTAFAATAERACVTNFPAVQARCFRVVFTSAFDPTHPESPRNAQVAEINLSGPKGEPLAGTGSQRRPLQMWEQKALIKPLSFSAPDTAPLLREEPAQPGEEDTRSKDVLDLTRQFDADGTLRWEAPPGEWEILRFGCTLNDHCRVSTCSDGWQGYALDPFDAGAFRAYWQAVVGPLIDDAGPLAGPRPQIPAHR